MHFLHAIVSDSQTRLLNVFGRTAMFWEIKERRIFYFCKPEVSICKLY